MLASLHISNYALIDNIDISFHSGLNIITGETGAGKSIILGALSLLLGGRADSKVIRHADVKSVIECEFDLNDAGQLRQLFIDSDLVWTDDNRCILRREIAPSGRSRAFVNDSPVSIATLQEVGLRLVDIHSQHQNQLLSQPAFQRQVLDSIAGNGPDMNTYTELYSTYREVLKKYKSAKATLARDEENADFMQYQLEQLDALDLQIGELERLRQERDTVADAAELKSNLNEALDALAEGETNAIDLIKRVQDACAELSELLDESDDIPARLDNVTVELNDISQSLTTLNSGLSADPADLDYTERRISAIQNLMRKHNVDTDEQLLEIQHKLRKRVGRLADAPNILSELEQKARLARRKAMEVAERISQARKEAAEKFSRRLTEVATPLGMKNLQCLIVVEPAEISSTGIDNVEFRFAFNKNQTPIPVSGAASGGEISRLMLSIKAIIADKIQLPSIIFDEVDTGVSGDVASRMGRMMLDISSSLQVIAITHLPQVAAKGHHHFKVYKADDEHATHTHIDELTPERRIDELALMLAGDPDNEAARANARSLMSSHQSDN